MLSISPAPIEMAIHAAKLILISVNRNGKRRFVLDTLVGVDKTNTKQIFIGTANTPSEQQLVAVTISSMSCVSACNRSKEETPSELVSDGAHYCLKASGILGQFLCIVIGLKERHKFNQ